MKVKIVQEIEKEAVTLHVFAGVRYWEDAVVDGINDTDGDRIPCRVGNLWCPVIDIDSGKITNWIQGVKADIHYKVCDSGSYFLKDANGETLLSVEDDYVPDIVPGEYGDYIVMEVMEDGTIVGWDKNASIDEFYQ